MTYGHIVVGGTDFISKCPRHLTYIVRNRWIQTVMLQYTNWTYSGYTSLHVLLFVRHYTHYLLTVTFPYSSRLKSGPQSHQSLCLTRMCVFFLHGRRNIIHRCLTPLGLVDLDNLKCLFEELQIQPKSC